MLQPDRHLTFAPPQALLNRLVAALALVGASLVGVATSYADDVVIDVNAQRKGNYPIALPVAGSDAIAKEIAQVQAFDLQVAGPFKVLDPAGFLDQTPGLAIDPDKWKVIGALGVVKYEATGADVEFRLFEVSRGTTAVLTKTYKRAGSNNRQIVHQWANEVMKYYTGKAGFFGSKIAFTAKSKKSNQIMAMDFDGANAYRVSNNSSTNILPAICQANGSQIAYTSFMRQNPDLYVGSLAGGRPKKLSSMQGMNTGASWSPDCSKIALTLSHNGSPDVYIIDASSGKVLSQITRDKAIDTSPSWSPDGGSIAFVSDRNGGPQIFVTSASGGMAKQVSFNGTYNTTPTWSPEPGKKIIAYTTRDGGHYDIVTLDLQTKAMVRITQGAGNNEEPAFSPDGRAIAFARSGQGVFIANADGSGKALKVWSGSATGVDWGPAPRP